MPILFEHQKKAIKELKNGNILCGGVGTGKSMTSLGYFMIRECDGRYTQNDLYTPPKKGKDLYIITTAKKRDSKEWDRELERWGLSKDKEKCIINISVIVDSWNNISKYKKIYGAFFIFDEQRLVGKGAWVKSFWDIANKNHWLLLSATPGDKWDDYFPVFKANGFYKTRYEFNYQHVLFDPFVKKYPKVKGYINEDKLEFLRNEVLVTMTCDKPAISHHQDIMVPYNIDLYSKVSKECWNIYEDKPIKQISERCYLERRVVNSDPERVKTVAEICMKNPRVIIFYKFNYELALLEDMCETYQFKYAEWNGHRHEEIPDDMSWVYLAQYNAACEGWECTNTNIVIFYSQDYSYRVTVQAAGRIDRLNTEYFDLYYYHIKSLSPIDKAISKALDRKEDFNELKYSFREDEG